VVKLSWTLSDNDMQKSVDLSSVFGLLRTVLDEDLAPHEGFELEPLQVILS
jgi:hypothetical protein